MGRAPCCDKANVKRGPWSPEEDMALKNYVERNGTGGNWIALPQKAGLRRCGKSCRLRWLNYLRPDIKHGGFTEEEDNIICTLYKSMGSRWSVIASQLRGRTDNDVKNYWNTKLKKKILAGKINLTGNSNHIQPTSSAPAIFSVSQSDNQEGLSNYLSQRSTTMPLSMDVNARQNTGSSRLVSDSIQFSIPGPSISPEFGFNVNNNYYITSDVTSHPLLDDSYSSWWSGNGIGEDDNRFLTDIAGFGSSFDLLSGAAAPTISNYYDSFLSNTSDTKPQGLYHSITN